MAHSCLRRLRAMTVPSIPPESLQTEFIYIAGEAEKHSWGCIVGFGVRPQLSWTEFSSGDPVSEEGVGRPRIHFEIHRI